MTDTGMVMTDEEFAEKHKDGPRHPAGCLYGGFSCGYWIISEDCDLEHWEKHYTRDDTCPCGVTFPGAGTNVVFFDATEDDE